MKLKPILVIRASKSNDFRFELFDRGRSVRKRDRFYWHMSARNGEIVCSSELRSTKHGSVKTIRRLVDFFKKSGSFNFPNKSSQAKR